MVIRSSRGGGRSARGRSGRIPADVLLVACVLTWGANFAVTKYAITHFFVPLAYSASRFGIATATFAGLSYARERTVRVDRRTLVLLVAVGSALILVNQLAFIYSLHLASASTVALLFGTMPIFAAIFSRERQSRRHWLAASVSFGGVALVALGATGGISGEVGGILLGICAPASWALYSVLLEPYVARYSPYRVNTIVSLACCVPYLAIAAPQLAHQRWGAVTATGWGALLFSSVIAYALTNLAWLVAIDRVGTARASIYVNGQPFLGAIFGVLLLSERLAAIQVAGGVVIAAGIVLARWRRPLLPPGAD